MVLQEDRRDLMLVMAAWVRNQNEATGNPTKRSLETIDRRMMDTGDSIWNYWKDEKSFHNFVNYHADKVSEIQNRLRDSSTKSAIEQFQRLISGGETTEGGSDWYDADAEPEAWREMETDARFKRQEDIESITAMLESFVAVYTSAAPAKRPDLIRKYAESIVAGKQ